MVKHKKYKVYILNISWVETENDYLVMDYENMSLFAIAACIDLYKIIDKQASEISTLKEQMAAVLAKLA